MPTLTLGEATRLFTNKELVINTFQGTNILSGLGQLSFNSGTWTSTLSQDFADVSTAVLETNDAAAYTLGTFYARGRYDSVSGNVAHNNTKSYVPGAAPEGSLYYQASASVLGLGVGNFSNSVGFQESNIEGARIKRPPAAWHQEEDGVTDIWEGFFQRYGYWEAKTKIPSSFRSDTAVTWSAWWLYTNVWKAPDHPPIELDIYEVYQGSVDNVSKAENTCHLHTTVHTHDTYKSNLYPGFISRDRNTSNSVNFQPNVKLGLDASFDFGDAFHRYGALITPKWLIICFDDLEVCRYPMIDALHQKFYPLLSSTVLRADVGTGAKAGINNFIEDVVVGHLVDWVKVYQNPDWNDLAIGGTANAKTVTTGLAMTGSYAAYDGRILVGISSTANTTTTPTLNANSLGALVVKKLSDNDGIKNPPFTGTPVALAVGDIKAGGRHIYELDVTNNCWILFNPANPVVDWTNYVPPAYAVPPITVDIETVEGQIMEKWRLLSLLPDTNPIKTSSQVDPNLVWPRVSPNYTFDVVIGASEGTIVGTVPVNNTPSGTPRASIDSTKYKIDPATGQITVGPSATITAEEIEVRWDAMGVPTPPGANISTVLINAVADQPFDLVTYFGNNLGAAWEFSKKPGNATLDGSNGISTMLDSSGFHLNGVQTDATKRIVLNLTALNGHPAAVMSTSNDALTLFDPIITTPLNAVNAFGVANDGSAFINLNGVTRRTAAYDFTQVHSLYIEWTSLEVFAWVNGSPITVTQAAGAITTNGWMLFFGKMDFPTGNSSVIYAANESDGMLFQSMGLTANSGVNGICGVVAGGKVSNTPIGRDKTIADQHWINGYQNLLPAGHRYKNVAPTLYNG